MIITLCQNVKLQYNKDKGSDFVYKIKEVCQMTGLTDRAIRLYVEQGLVEPEISEGIHNKAYFFCDENVERLKDIATLRNAGFSLADIKLMIEDPINISSLVEEKEALLEVEINRMKAVQETLNRLTIQEHNDVTKLADAIEPRSTYAKETPRDKMSRWKKALIWVIVFAVILMLFALKFGVIIIWAILSTLGITGGLFFVCMSIGYFRYNHYTGKEIKHTIGKVIAIVSDDGIEEYIGKSKYADFRELLTMGFFHWNDVRPDHWFPIIQFEMEDGKCCTSTFRYGGLKSTWMVGEYVKIAWEGEKTIYPYKAEWLKKKTWIYLMLGIGMLLIAWLSVNYIV